MMRRGIKIGLFGLRWYHVLSALISIPIFLAAVGKPWTETIAGFFNTYLPNTGASWPIIVLLGVAIIGGLAVYVFLRALKLFIPVVLFLLGVGVSLQLVAIPDIILKSSPGLQSNLLTGGIIVAAMGAFLLLLEYRK